MSTHDKPRSPDKDGTIPLLKLLECLPPSVAEIVKAADSAAEPRFLLRLNRPLTPDERRVVALELPNATLHHADDPHLTLAVGPDQVIERPQAIQMIVRGISSVAITLRRSEVELLAECEGAALAVNELLHPFKAGASSAREPSVAAGARSTHRARHRPLRA